jgi:peptidoglycan/xylan/chitin deacetylase (PgdA/CDA1 family)
MSLRHRLKRGLCNVYARLLWHTGLARLVDRWSAPRLTILYGHCVDDPAVNGQLAPEMRLSEARLEHLLRTLGKRFDLVTIGEGMARLARGDARRSMVALSMDDGYWDNLTRLVPLLERSNARATVFLEAGPVVERRLGWLHTFEALVTRLGAAEVGRRLLAAWEGAEVRGADDVARATDANGLKRALKYRVEPGARDAALGELAQREGLDVGALVRSLYMDTDGARALARSGRIEVGGHTVDHPVLSTLDAAAQQAEIVGGRALLAAALAGELGEHLVTFAYPYGRRWDFDATSAEGARGAGFRWAVTTHAGTNTAATDPLRIARWPIEEHTPLHHLGAEASGGFALLRRFGIDLVE